MSSINRVVLVGRVGRAPEPNRTTKSGKAVCELTVATSSKRGGEEVTQWHRVTLWDKTAEVAARYCTKGSLVGIEGRLTYETWEKDGQKHTTAKIVAEQLTLLGSKRTEDGDRPGFARAPAEYDAGDGKGSSVPDDDDIPF